MRKHRYSITAFAVPLALAALTLPGMGMDTVYAQAAGMGAPPSKVEITIRDRQHGYETVGLTMPSHDTVIVVRNLDTVTHGFASNLFKGIPVRVEGGAESLRYALWCDIHPEVTGEVYVIETRGEFGGG